MNLLGMLTITLICALAAPTLVEFVGFEAPSLTRNASAVEGRICDGSSCVFFDVDASESGVDVCLRHNQQC